MKHLITGIILTLGSLTAAAQQPVNERPEQLTVYTYVDGEPVAWGECSVYYDTLTDTDGNQFPYFANEDPSRSGFGYVTFVGDVQVYFNLTRRHYSRREVEQAQNSAASEEAFKAAVAASAASGSKDLLEQFIVDYPASERVSEARARIKDIEENWQFALDGGTAGHYVAYIKVTDFEELKPLAEKRAVELRDDLEWSQIGMSTSLKNVQNYLERYEHPRHEREARALAAAIQAMEAYNRQQYAEAYAFMTEADAGGIAIPTWFDPYRPKIDEEYTFIRMTREPTPPQQWRAYIDRYPRTPHLTDAYRHYVRALADDFRPGVTKEQYKQVEAMARQLPNSDELLQYVKQRYKAAK